MNDLFIQGISLHWDKVGKDSYLREIAAFQGLDQIRFNKPVTFFAGETAAASQPCWKRSRWHTDLIRKAEQGIIISQHETRIPNFVMPLRSQKGTEESAGDIFFGRKASIMWPRRKNSMPMQHTLRHYTTKNLMAKAFCSLRKTISVGTAYISLTSRKPRFPHKGS